MRRKLAGHPTGCRGNLEGKNVADVACGALPEDSNAAIHLCWLCTASACFRDPLA
jgi:hypothetical protein